MKRIILIGPFPEPLTGNSLANKIAFEAINESSDFIAEIVNTSLDHFDEHVGSFSFQKFLFFLKFNLQIYKIIRNDIIYVTPGQTFFGVAKYGLFILFGSVLKKEIIVHIHGNHLRTEYETLTGIKKKILGFLLSKSAKGIVLSELLRRNLTPFLQANLVYPLYNFAEDYVAQGVGIESDGGLRIIFLSNLMSEKGIFELLDALNELERLEFNYEARIAGAMDKGVEAILLEKMNALRKTSYLGIVFGDEKKKLLDWGNTFVLPTYYKMEGQPISIIEALATRNVIVTTSHAGIPDIISEPRNGFFVEKKDYKSIVEVLRKLGSNQLLMKRIGDNNQKDFNNRFTLSKFKEGLIRIFLENNNPD